LAWYIVNIVNNAGDPYTSQKYQKNTSDPIIVKWPKFFFALCICHVTDAHINISFHIFEVMSGM